MRGTAMQQLRDKLNKACKDLNPDSNSEGNYRLALENVIKDIDAQMLERERLHIEIAFNQGKISQIKNPYLTSEQYYWQKYGKY